MRTRGLLVWLTVWSAAFGVTEGAVVTYLRRLCYPDQPLSAPLFPLRNLSPSLILTEIAREAATLLMLLGVAMLAERRPLRRFAVFAFCFGVWDIAYYATLWIAIGWPRSLLEWDVLFLIPAPWAAPVLAPVLVSLGLVGGAWVILARHSETMPSPFTRRDWWVMAACGAVILWSFLWNSRAVAWGKLPGSYPWGVFLAGWLGGLACFANAWRSAAARGEVSQRSESGRIE